MKTSTKILLWVVAALFLATFITLDKTIGIIAAGIIVFCFITDRELRREF